MYKFFHYLLWFLTKIIFFAEYKGIENVKGKKGVIVCSNHISFIDPVMAVCAIPDGIDIMGKSELFKIPIFGFLARGIGAFPIDRGTADMDAIELAKSKLREGKKLGLYPEGTRSKNGKLGRFKSGAVYLAAATGADIIPCYIKTKHGKVFAFRKITVIYGEAIKNEDLGDITTDRKSLKRATEVIRGKIAKLGGEEI